MITTVYISGKITGTTDYRERFEKAEEKLIAQGYDVVNPAKINANLPTICTHDDYMKVCIAELSICDTIYLLRGYGTSKGALEELAYAINHDYTIIAEVGND